MDRKSIFEILEFDLNYNKEIERIEHLLRDYDNRYGNLYNVIAKYYLNWPYRDTTINIDSLYITLEFGDIANNPFKFINAISEEMFLRYCEMMVNLTYIYFGIVPQFDKNPFCANQINSIINNIKITLSKIGYKVYCCENEKKYIVVQNNVEAAMAAELVDDANAKRIMEYNRYLLRGNLEGKRNILKNLADLFEGQRKKLDANNLKSLADDIGFLVNTFDIRHNNQKGRIVNKYLERIEPAELEKWYDKTYCLIIASIISLEKIELGKEVAQLKAEVEKANKGE